MTALRRAFRPPDIHVVVSPETIKAARESARRELRSRLVVDNQLRVLIARYDAMLLAAMEDKR